MELYQIRYFVQVCLSGSILQASEELLISQPAITRAIQKLEGELGLKLFTRTKNSVKLNENGEKILEDCKMILSLADKLKSDAKNMIELKNTLRIGVTAPAPFLKYPELFSLDSGYKVEAVTKSEEELIKLVRNSLLDIAFINRKVDDEILRSVKGFRECLYFFLPNTHFLSKLKGVHFKEADGQSFLLAKSLGPWNDITAKMLPNSKFYYQDNEALSELINESNIPGFVTDISLKFKSDSKRVAIPILDEEAKMDFYLLYKKADERKLTRIISLIESL